jgi:HD superfamily phosphohydrolase
MNFEQTLQQWLVLDNEIKNYNQKLKEVRIKQKNAEELLIKHANNKNLLNTTLNLQNERLKFMNTKVTQPLTFKYLEKSLGEIIKNSEQVNTIVNHIKNNRDCKIVTELKRFYNN